MTSDDPTAGIRRETCAFEVRPQTEDDRSWVVDLLAKQWGATSIVSRGRVHEGHLLPGFAAISKGQVVGLVTHCIEGEQCEIVTLDSLQDGQGIGTALVEAVRRAARASSCKRLWLITTNDNLHALRFYQRRGFRLAALHAGTIPDSRRLKPSIPLIGMDGIPIRDEIELDMFLSDDENSTLVRSVCRL